MQEARLKFQELLRQLFQFDCADLDFGIYRIMNYKRDVIEQFVTKDLLDAVSEELGKGVLAEQTQATHELQSVAQQIEEALGEEALDASGNLLETYHGSRLGKKYLELREKAAGGHGREAIEASIFNHLYSFFSRYYQEGDFISKRRYSNRQKYAIPYNGEEVHLHWANNDQYYIKTGEYFHDYTFTSHGVTVHFKVQEASVEQNNVKGDNRFFVPLVKEIKWEEENNQLVIPFDYRTLSEKEKISYGKKNQQEAIIGEAIEEIPKQLKKKESAVAAVAAERSKNGNGRSVTFLEYHLRQYTRRNTSDFFIHKNLNRFLGQELDFYIKNDVLNLDEIESGGEGRSEGWFQIMHVIKVIGGRINEFLAQIENFQKMLWEKRKFITDTHYCITVGNIEENLYNDIVECEAQWSEWKELLHIDEGENGLFTNGKKKNGRRITFLKKHPTLAIDTKNFDHRFTDRLLASFDDIDGITDGILVHSENFQALNILSEKYRKQVKCVHVDPPYNTQTSGFLYKNDYQHSCWLAMMENRIVSGLSLMSEQGAFLCHIDENEYELLHLLFTRSEIPDGGTVIWDKKNPMLGRKGVATQHEYILWRTHENKPIYIRPVNVRKILAKAEALLQKHGGVTNEVRKEFSSWLSSCEGLTGGDRAYRLMDADGRVFQSVAMGAPEPRTDPKFHVPLVHPITGKECPIPSNGWSRTPENLQQLVANGEIVFGADETVQPRKKVYLTDESKRQLSSVISDASRGKMDIEKLGLEFPYCHPVSLYEELIGAGTSGHSDIVLDFFAGSGTNGHAVINLNREDGRQRKFILVEMGNYFDTVLLPRIKKVTFSPEWKNGKPIRMASEEEADYSPRIIKYISVESYEDSLNNIQFEDGTAQSTLKFEDFMLQYMLKWETRKSETLLNIENLSNPFGYKLNIHQDGQTQEKPIDLPETFNYLLGLHVSKRHVAENADRRYLVYRGQVDHRQITVIWRETTDWKKEDYEQDKDFVEAQDFTAGADEIFVNGDSMIPNAKSLDAIFKARMFAEIV